MVESIPFLGPYTATRLRFYWNHSIAWFEKIASRAVPSLRFIDPHRKTMYTRCSLCKEEGHNAAKCPELTDPLQPGFSGAGGGGGNSHDHDDDESLSFSDVSSYQTTPIRSRIPNWFSLRPLSGSQKIETSHCEKVYNAL